MRHLPWALALGLAALAYVAYFVQDVGHKLGTWPF